MVGETARPSTPMTQYFHECREKGEYDNHIWLDKGEWIFDTDNGMRGPTIEFCPYCGIKLIEPNKTQTV